VTAWDKVKTVAEIPDFVKLLLYGPPGFGKTTFVGDSPNPVWIDLERSTEVFRGHPEYSKIPVIVPDNKKEFLDLIKSVHTTNYETLVIDTVSQLQDIHLYEEMLKVEEATKKRPSPRSRYLPLFQEFRISTEELKEASRILQKADINVVVIAHDRVYTKVNEQTGDTQVVAIRPDMTPRVIDAMNRIFNVVAYLDKETSLTGAVTRKLYMNSTKTIAAKNRFRIEQLYLTNPTWKDLKHAD
jgi:phage nucleotide-binding protein